MAPPKRTNLPSTEPDVGSLTINELKAELERKGQPLPGSYMRKAGLIKLVKEARAAVLPHREPQNPSPTERLASDRAHKRRRNPDDDELEDEGDGEIGHATLDPRSTHEKRIGAIELSLVSLKSQMSEISGDFKQLLKRLKTTTTPDGNSATADGNSVTSPEGLPASGSTTAEVFPSMGAAILPQNPKEFTDALPLHKDITGLLGAGAFNNYMPELLSSATVHMQLGAPTWCNPKRLPAL